MLPEKPPLPQSPTSELRSEEPVAERTSKSPSPATNNHTEQREKPPLPSEQPPPLLTEAPPLPAEAPPLPNEVPPSQPTDDGWEPVWDEQNQAFYFFNRFTNTTQWENPRVPDSAQAGPPGVGNHDRIGDKPKVAKVAGGYDPAIHGDYDPNADYAKSHEDEAQDAIAVSTGGVDAAQEYAATATFNRFTGKWQRPEFGPDRFSDDAKSRRQMNAFFDVDAAANSHDGRSLKAERANRKLSKAELKAFKEKRRDKKEEKRRAWLRD